MCILDGWVVSRDGQHFGPAFTGNGQFQTWLWATYNDGQCGGGTCPFPDVSGTNGFAYHLQDLVFLPYFGAAQNTSWGPGWFSFQEGSMTVCQ
jgi:hypothetical protein